MFTCTWKSTDRLARIIACGLLFAMFAQLIHPLNIIAAPNPHEHTVDADETLIPDGTEIEVKTMEEISSKNVAEGDPLTFRVNEDVTVNGRIVIARGSQAKGIVSGVEKSGRMGRGGKPSIRVESTTTVDGQKIKLRSTQGKSGNDKTGTTVALVVLFGPLGFLKKGSEAKIKEGTIIRAFTDEEKKVQIKGSVL